MNAAWEQHKVQNTNPKFIFRLIFHKNVIRSHLFIPGETSPGFGCWLFASRGKWTQRSFHQDPRNDWETQQQPGSHAQIGSQSFVRFGLFILIDQLISLLILISFLCCSPPKRNICIRSARNQKVRSIKIKLKIISFPYELCNIICYLDDHLDIHWAQHKVMKYFNGNCMFVFTHNLVLLWIGYFYRPNSIPNWILKIQLKRKLAAKSFLPRPTKWLRNTTATPKANPKWLTTTFPLWYLYSQSFAVAEIQILIPLLCPFTIKKTHREKTIHLFGVKSTEEAADESEGARIIRFIKSFCMNQ